MDWSVYGDFNGQYVRFEAIELVQGVPGTRPDMLFASADQGSQINTYDTSVCFRNDRGAAYFPNGGVAGVRHRRRLRAAADRAWSTSRAS